MHPIFQWIIIMLPIIQLLFAGIPYFKTKPYMCIYIYRICTYVHAIYIIYPIYIYPIYIPYIYTLYIYPIYIPYIYTLYIYIYPIYIYPIYIYIPYLYIYIYTLFISQWLRIELPPDLFGLGLACDHRIHQVPSALRKRGPSGHGDGRPSTSW